MKNKMTLLAFAIIGMAGFMSFQTAAQEISPIDCQDNVCIVDEAKNRFLAKGCKDKPTKDCKIKGPKAQ